MGMVIESIYQLFLQFIHKRIQPSYQIIENKNEWIGLDSLSELVLANEPSDIFL